MLDRDITIREPFSYPVKHCQFFSREHNGSLAVRRAYAMVARRRFATPQFLLARNEVQQRRRDGSKCLQMPPLIEERAITPKSGSHIDRVGYALLGEGGSSCPRPSNGGAEQRRNLQPAQF